jgi:lysozyme
VQNETILTSPPSHPQRGRCGIQGIDVETNGEAKMNRQKIMDQLIIDEGKQLTVYRDSVGLPTIGIGHLILPSDNIPEGSEISDERCKQLFQHDLDHAITQAQIMFPALDIMPETIQEVIVNLIFNMGPKRLEGFHHFIAAINAKDYVEAAVQLKESAWYKQVGIRAIRLVTAVQECSDILIV